VGGRIFEVVKTGWTNKGLPRSTARENWETRSWTGHEGKFWLDISGHGGQSGNGDLFGGKRDQGLKRSTLFLTVKRGPTHRTLGANYEKVCANGLYQRPRLCIGPEGQTIVRIGRGGLTSINRRRVARLFSFGPLILIHSGEKLSFNRLLGKK